jgi:hypothetical protein
MRAKGRLTRGSPASHPPATSPLLQSVIRATAKCAAIGLRQKILTRKFKILFARREMIM